MRVERDLISDLLKEFFETQYKNGLQRRFVEALSSDFDTVLREFNDFICKKHSSSKSSIENINFHEALAMIMKEVCSFKLDCIKGHTKMLLESTERAKKKERITKDGKQFS